MRTSETEGSVTFTASKAGTYYYQLDGEPASAADIMKDEAKAELVRGANTISLKDLDANAHTVYIAAKDAFGPHDRASDRSDPPRCSPRRPPPSGTARRPRGPAWRV